jgi:alkyl hydroperoxide reductase subunit AhpC
MPGTPNPDAPWLIILFIPAAFSFVCPTEVLAFQNCLDEFKDRRCSVVFVSVDTKHSLWHWQNVPRQYGGLGMIDIPLLSDATHRISRDYGVLIEDEGVSLRGMFIIDGEGIVQQVRTYANWLYRVISGIRTDHDQITLNNLTVGRSVVEALRLLEAFQAVAKHGVLCPVDWKPSDNAQDTINTISNTLTESYVERLANLQKEFGGEQVTDLDAKHKSDDDIDRPNAIERAQISQDDSKISTPRPNIQPLRSHSSPQVATIQEVSCQRARNNSPLQPQQTECVPHPPSPTGTLHSTRSSSSPHSADNTSLPTPQPTTYAHKMPTARHARGTTSFLYVHSLFSPSMSTPPGSPSDSDRQVMSGHHSTPAPPRILLRTQSSSALLPRNLSSSSLTSRNTYESRRGEHVVLKFEDPTANPLKSPQQRLALVPPPKRVPPTLSRATTWTGPGIPVKETELTRLQAAFGAIRALASPMVEGKGSFEYSAGVAEGDEN